MDAPTPSPQPASSQPASSRSGLASRTPLSIGECGLVVRDLDRCTAFYRDIVGLDLLARDEGGALLGVASVPLLTLTHRPDALPDDKREAGLFHIAFAMPTRQHLAEWHVHALRQGFGLSRTGDHLVNEALYYDDPEGNGCECYADRPAEDWLWHADGSVEITTGKTIDLDELAALAKGGEGWRTPPSLRIGHVNLRVGDTATAEQFWCDAVGLDHTGRRRVDFSGRASTITFFSSGRYHHHLAANDFSSRGAGPRDPARAGLAYVTVAAESDTVLDRVRKNLGAAGVRHREIPGGFAAPDPWGTEIRFVLRP